LSRNIETQRTRVGRRQAAHPSAAEKKQRKEDEKQKDALLKALCTRAKAEAALCNSEPGLVDDRAAAALAQLDMTMKAIHSWVDPL
jgi:hypothetical protein